MRSSRISTILIVTLLLVLCFATGISATDYSYVQDNADNPTKFSIDKKIADGFSTDDLYIGTTKAYLGDKADGSTPIFKDGLAIHPADIFITNGKVGIVLAIGTADPWGYPGGSILDAGRVNMPEGSTDWSEATFGSDTILTCQFLFNSWDEWAPVNCGMVYCDLVKYNFDTKQLDEKDGTWAVQINRKYTVPNAGVQRDFDIISYYSIAPGADYAYMFDTVINKGNERIDEAINNDISMSNKGGDGIDTKTIFDLKAANTYNWVADKNGDPKKAFSTTLIVPGDNESNDGSKHPFNRFSGATGYREFLFEDSGFDPGESRVYQSYLMIDDECSWQKVYDFYADYNELETFGVSGKVTTVSGEAAEYPVVLVYRDGKFYGWVMGDKSGNYKVSLPDEGEEHSYDLRVELTDTVTGDPCDAFTTAADGSTINLTAGAEKVPVTFNFTDADTGKPVYGRVMVGTTPTAAFTGKSYFLPDNTADGELEENGYGPGTKGVVKGTVTAMVAPGEYTATCYGEGFRFSSYIEGSTGNRDSIVVKGNTETDTVQNLEVKFDNPTPEDWYSIDNHHHGIRMDAFAEPEVVAKAQVVSGLDVLTLDDHEFVLDNWPVYQWGQKMGIIGYMPSEEVTASWAHFDIMPLSVDSYEQHLDRDQENVVVNTNQSFAGMMDQGHLFGASIGANHPTYSYGLLLADTNKTVPGGLNDEFDGLEAQSYASYTNEAMAYWTAFAHKEAHRNVQVERPHYIWGSTDIHTSGTSANSGNSRSYVFLEDGEAISEENFDTFGLEFARSQALGHSFVSSGVYITPATADLMYGETYWTDKNGDFTAKFDISSLGNIKKIYVFSSIGKDVVPENNKLSGYKYLLSTSDVDGDKTAVENFRVNLTNIEGKQWFAIGAEDSRGRMAFTNPIWINGPDVKTETITSVKFQTEPTLPEAIEEGETIEAPTSAGILITDPWSVRMVEDWTLKGADFGITAEGGQTYTFELTYEAPKGYVFDQAIGETAGFTVSADGSTLVYSKDITVPGGDLTQIPYVAKEGENTDYIVAKLGDQIIARSWYDAENQVLNVISAESGNFEVYYANVQSFDDTKGRWMDNAARYLRARNVAYGIGNNLYAPDNNITRAEFTSLLVRMLNLELGDLTPTEFRDADSIPAYAKEAIDIASAYGLVEGYQGIFAPNDQITRQDMFIITYRALVKMEMIPAEAASEATFPDFADTSDYAKAGISVLSETGLVNGDENNRLLPKKQATRGECLQFLFNVLQLDR